MEYSEPYPSSVPHVILAPETVLMSSTFYVSSLIVQIYFLFMSVAFLALSIYFRCGNYRLMIDQSRQPQQKKQAQNIICQVIAKTNYLQKMQEQTSSDDGSSNYQQSKSKSAYDTQKAAPALRLFQRRAVYLLTFTAPWVFCISFFDANIVLVIFGAVFLALGIVLNVIRVLPSWKITILIYILPALAGITPYMSGTKLLYTWEPVLNPLIM